MAQANNCLAYRLFVRWCDSLKPRFMPHDSNSEASPRVIDEMSRPLLKAEIERWLKGNNVLKAMWLIDKATGTSLKRPEF